MSDAIKHECGVAMIVLHKPLQYYIDKYNTPSFALEKLYIMMEKQRNRGQDGVGMSIVKKDIEIGKDFIYRERSAEQNGLKKIFDKAYNEYNKLSTDKFQDAEYLNQQCSSFGNIYLGHLRYGTHGEMSESVCHPFYRKSNWRSRNLVLAGNFNLTNVDELLEKLISLGQHPRQKADTVLVLEKIGHFLDEEVEKLHIKYKNEGLSNQEISEKIEGEIDIAEILKQSVKGFDGGYVMTGILGYGDAFVFRDPNGIRPCHYFSNDEFTVVASERPAIATTFNIDYDSISELPPAHALILKDKKELQIVSIQGQSERKSCSFERIYFARGTDSEIYYERKMLGKLLAPIVYEKIKKDFKNTVFSFIPNTAELAYMGLIKGLEMIYRKNIIKSLDDNTFEEKSTTGLVEGRIREEKLIIKDVKMRTFIANDSSRDDLVSHVYDITYNSIKKNTDTICVIDDSIVRGTTLKKSIINILSRLKPKKIMVVSSAPMIKYPDCYGIDMSNLGDLLAFRATEALVRKNGKEAIMREIYEKCKLENAKPRAEIQNIVNEFYALFSDEEIINEASSLVTPPGLNCEVELVFQTVENLHKACPNDTGDWYFSGNYATSGGNKVANTAFINFIENKTGRSY